MGNGRKRHQCVALTSAGDQCNRPAREGHQTCGLKAHREQEDKPKVIDRTPRDPPSESVELELEYESLARKCVTEMDAARADGVRVQWMRLAVDCVRLLKEERRLALTDGQRPIHVTLGISQPDKPRPDA
jgi:hypothetical protein